MSETLHHTRHEISNNDQVANAHAKALDGDRRVEYHSRVGVCDLTEGKEAGRATIQISRTASLKIEAEARGKTRPADDKHAQDHAHVGHGVRHGQDSSADNGVDQVDDGGYP